MLVSDDPRIEPLARAMCAEWGNNPDDTVLPVAYQLERLAGRADFAIVRIEQACIVAAWSLWTCDAMAALAHIDGALARVGQMAADAEALTSKPEFHRAGA